MTGHFSFTTTITNPEFNSFFTPSYFKTSRRIGPVRIPCNCSLVRSSAFIIVTPCIEIGALNIKIRGISIPHRNTINSKNTGISASWNCRYGKFKLKVTIHKFIKCICCRGSKSNFPVCSYWRNY